MILPSLAALRAFEAAARTGSFSAAARELNVTHAAVAQQVRALEAQLGQSLAFREGRGLGLTGTGQRLGQQLTEAFRQIRAAVAEARAEGRARPLRVSVTPAFAARWLLPRLRGFWAAHPDVALAIHPEERLVDLRREAVDVAVRFGRGGWAGVVADLLLPAEEVVVGSPALTGGRALLTAAEMQALPWILETGWSEQRAVLSGMGLDPDALEATEVTTEELALIAARQGYGLALVARALAADDIAEGRLAAVHANPPEAGLGYYAVVRSGPQRPEAAAFLRWLRAAARAEAAGRAARA
jgi:LysR family glycine cleavage system transcriptional activator